MRANKIPFPAGGIVGDLVAEEPNLPGSIQGLCRLNHIVCTIHDIPPLKTYPLNLGPLPGIVSRPCFLLASGRLEIHFMIRSSPAFLVGHGHERLDADASQPQSQAILMLNS